MDAPAPLLVRPRSLRRLPPGRARRRSRSIACRSTSAKGETVALVGESGSGKSVTALSVMKLLPYPSAQPSDGLDHVQGPGPAAAASIARCAHVRGNDITIIFQEPMTSLNPLHTIEKQIGEILLLHQGLTGEAARTRIARPAHPGRHPRAGIAAAELSAPAFRRPAPARDDRDGARQRARPAHRRRADDRARRHRAGADPARCSRTCRRGSAWRCCSSPTTSASCASSPTRSA